MYIVQLPKLVITVKGFDDWGELVPIGYAHIDLPSETGHFKKQAYVYSIIRN